LFVGKLTSAAAVRSDTASEQADTGVGSGYRVHGVFYIHLCYTSRNGAKKHAKIDDTVPCNMRIAHGYHLKC